ncbi:hypothetical protein [Teredinibacter sp. KSP-S5-2]|uniref:hypothetical protein n=1 Tax=Teredinibacter sp. KSP-S5-2 TaxID=3034506 RepID=UPI002934D7EF|nr:hypothetical protein [Teredinibacter sp. KSP-S5-2]WNO11007.1 hypothetical protein P5V12_07430 [Teredinibacter sp. KSP-S5-2]
MNSDNILTQLFFYEESNELVAIENLPPLNDTGLTRYNDWIEGKRTFALEEICTQHWIKTCSAGYITEVIFHPDGSLEEFTLFERNKTTGQWFLEEGILHLEIRKNESLYKSAVIADWSSPIHTAIEYKDDELHSYLKVIQTRPHLTDD